MPTSDSPFENEDFLSIVGDLYSEEAAAYTPIDIENEERYFDENGWESLIEEEPPEGLQTKETLSSRARKTPHEVLKKYWGYSAFREKQLDIIEGILQGRDVLGLMPTGGGKSITFQVPGLILQGTTIVVTPLIALMKDQVQQLKVLGIKAACIHSGLTLHDIRSILSNAAFGGTKFLYISPERIVSPFFEAALNYLNISLIVVDECHCISQWGYDFRPSYLNIIKLRQKFPSTPLVALTATATEQVIGDIVHELRLREPLFVKKSFARPNISYVVKHCHDKIDMLIRILKAVPGSAIVYCRNRNLTAELVNTLREQGLTADNYHAGLTHADRDIKQELWMKGELRVIVATNAFGMGINKPDVRSVIHWAMPPTLEEYYQEAGRAGRDGKASFAVVLCDGLDQQLLIRRLKDEFPPLDYIRYTYDMLMSYLQIGIGDGYGRVKSFDIENFIRVYHMHPIRTLSAIRILEMAGLFVYKTKEENRSRIQIIPSRNELYAIASIKGKSEAILTYLLRRIPGIFSEYGYFEEKAIAHACQMSEEEVYEQLKNLAHQRIVRYIPKRSTPTLLICARREPGRLLIFSDGIYKNRRERYEKSIEHVLQYLQQQHGCRASTLLHYFGEEQSAPCGTCDLCRRKQKKKLTESEKIAILKQRLRMLLQLSDKVAISSLLQVQEDEIDSWQKALYKLIDSTTHLRIDGDRIIKK